MSKGDDAVTDEDEGARIPDGDSFVRALDRGLSILALFDVEHHQWTVGSICERTGLRKATVYRMVRTLEARGLLSYDPAAENYRLGRALIPQAYLVLSHVEFVRAVHPFLEALAEQTGETAELAVESEEGSVVVDQVGTSHPFKLDMPIGRVLPGTANANMKLFAAWRTRAAGPTPGGARLAPTPARLHGGAKATSDPIGIATTDLAFDLEETDAGVCAVSALGFRAGRRIGRGSHRCRSEGALRGDQEKEACRSRERHGSSHLNVSRLPSFAQRAEERSAAY